MSKRQARTGGKLWVALLATAAPEPVGAMHGFTPVWAGGTEGCGRPRTRFAEPSRAEGLMSRLMDGEGCYLLEGGGWGAPSQEARWNERAEVVSFNQSAECSECRAMGMRMKVKDGDAGRRLGE